MNYTTTRRKFNTLCKSPKVIINKAWRLFEPIVSDRLFLKVSFRMKVGYWPDLDNPKTYNEKLQWLKLYNKHPEYSKMVDKIEAKKYVASIIGDEYIIPTLGTWNNVDEINWDSLPNQFVIKVTNDSGGIVVCKDKTKLDIKKAKKILQYGWGRNYYRFNKEYPYKDVKPRIIAEQYMSDGDENGLRDYKFFCFKGTPKVMFLLKDRNIDTRLNFYDLEFNKLPFERGYPNFDDEVEKPKGWNEMITLAEKLSKDIAHIRVDFYNIKGKIYFGELTFFPGSGMERFKPKEWDTIMGDWIELPPTKINRGDKI